MLQVIIGVGTSQKVKGSESTAGWHPGISQNTAIEHFWIDNPRISRANKQLSPLREMGVGD